MSDELDGLDALPPGSPLHDRMLAELDRQPLEVPDAAASRVATATQRRMPRSRAWNGLIVLAAAATLAVVGWTAVETNPLDAATSWFEDPADREVALRTQAVTLHKEGRTDEDPDVLAAADAAYAEWFVEFEGTDKDPTMRYAWAELKYKLEDYGAAHALYLDVVTDHPDHPQAQFCGKSAIFAADQLVAQQVPAALDTFDATVAAYVEHWPDDPTATAAMYKAGYHRYGAGHHAQAREWFDAVIADGPSDQASKAMNLVVDTYALADDIPGMVDRLAAAFAETPYAVDADLVDVTVKLLEGLPESDPGRLALEAAYHGWATDQLNLIGYVDDGD